MSEYYILKNIRNLLSEGFSKEELIDLCFYEPKLKSICDQFDTNATKNEIMRQILDYAHQKLQIDTLLTVAKEANPSRYERHQPYFQNVPKHWKPILDNDLGFGISIGGLYQEHPLEALAIGWSDYGFTLVKSGWLYVAQLGQCHSVAFFKIHIKGDGTGYIHIVDVSSPPHIVWLETDAGFRKEEKFHYIQLSDGSAQSAVVWDFRWNNES